MEKQKRLTLYAIVAMALITLGFWSSFEPQRAYAQTFQVLSGFTYPIKAMFYQAQNDLIWVLSADTSSSKVILYWIDRSTLSTVGSFNHTNNIANGTALRAEDIWCGKTDCFITSGQGSGNGQVVRISTENIAPNIFRGQNVTGRYTHTTPHLMHLTGVDVVSGGFGSVTMWINACTNAGCTTEGIIIVDGISMTLTTTLPAYSTGSSNAAHDLQWSGIAGTNDNDLVTVVGSNVPNVASNHLVVFNLATLSIKCDVQLPLISGQVALGLGVATNYFAAGSALNKIYVSAHNGVIFVYDDNCNLLQTIVGSGALQTGLSTQVRFIEYSGGRVFAQEDGANAKLSQMLTNSSGHIITNGTIYFPLPSSSQATFDTVLTRFNIGDMILFSGFGKVWFPYTGTDRKIGILTYSSAPTGQTVCIDTDLDGVTDLCFTDTNGDGVPDNGQLGALGAYRSNANLTDFGTDVFCAFGISTAACTNQNIKTNGVGVTFLALLVIFSYAMLVTIHIFAQQRLHRDNVQVVDALNIHPILLLVMLIVDVGIAFQLGWIANEIFYTVIIILIGLAGFGIYRKVRSGGI